jgi:FkbM family methyltransferase
LDGPLRILDLGANIGTFGVFALARWSVDTMESFEPDPANVATLNDTIALNHAGHYWRAHQAAVSTVSGHMTFIPGHFSQSRRADEEEAGIDVRSTCSLSMPTLTFSRWTSKVANGRFSAIHAWPIYRRLS